MFCFVFPMIKQVGCVREPLSALVLGLALLTWVFLLQALFFIRSPYPLILDLGVMGEGSQWFKFRVTQEVLSISVSLKKMKNVELFVPFAFRKSHGGQRQ